MQPKLEESWKYEINIDQSTFKDNHHHAYIYDKGRPLLMFKEGRQYSILQHLQC